MPAGPQRTVAISREAKAAEGSLSMNTAMQQSAPAANKKGTPQWKRRSPVAQGFCDPQPCLCTINHMHACEPSTWLGQPMPCAPDFCELLASSSIQAAASPKGSTVSSATVAELLPVPASSAVAVPLAGLTCTGAPAVGACSLFCFTGSTERPQSTGIQHDSPESRS